MSIVDSYLFEAGWLFFAFWTVILGVVSVTAFRRDLFPSRVAQHSPTPNPAPPVENRPN